MKRPTFVQNLDPVIENLVHVCQAITTDKSLSPHSTLCIASGHCLIRHPHNDRPSNLNKYTVLSNCKYIHHLVAFPDDSMEGDHIGVVELCHHCCLLQTPDLTPARRVFMQGLDSYLSSAIVRYPLCFFHF